MGIAAEEAHRADNKKHGKNTRYPLIEKNIDRAGCKEIILNAELCLPAKSGCWCCPFMRVGEILDLINVLSRKTERIY